MAYTIRILMIALYVVAVGHAVSATTINVDFNQTGAASGTYVGTAAAPDAGTKWNGISTGTGVSLSNALFGSFVDSQNNPVAVTLTVTVDGGFDGPFYSTPSDYSNTGAAALADDQFYANPGNTRTIVINNLNASKKYALYIYEDRDDSNVGASQTSFTVTDNSGPLLPITSTDDNPLTAGFNSPEDYVLFTWLTPTALNQLRIDFAGAGTSRYGAISGFQLMIVPEPASGGLLLFSSFALMWIRSRQRR